MTDLSSYKQLYLETATAYMEALQRKFPEFVLNQSSEELIEVLYRSAHSLKSQSLVMGYQSTGELCMELEYIFRQVKDKQLIMTEQLVKALEESFQKLYDSIDSIKNADKEIDLSSEKVTLQNISGVK